MPPRRVLISAGDHSGDEHAAAVMRRMRELSDESIEFVGFGLDAMAAEGLRRLDAEERGSEMWLQNILRLGHFGRRLGLCKRELAAGSIDLVVLVDYGGFNLCLARAASRAGVPVLYYILPQVWAHGTYRLKKIRRWVTRCLVIYPFEPALYREWGVEAEFVGHPLFDRPEGPFAPEGEVSRLREQLGGGRLVGLFPGSRQQEVRSVLPIMLDACARVRREFPDVVYAAVCPERLRERVRQMCVAAGVEVELPAVPPTVLARASEFCVAKSGTITLEIAGQRTPNLIVYRVSPLFYFLGKGVARTQWVGIVNNLAGREVCPERVMWRDEPDWIYGQVKAWLTDLESREKCREGIDCVMAELGRPGASDRAARVALEMLKQSEKT